MNEHDMALLKLDRIDRIGLLNLLLQACQYESYLEIGVNAGNAFRSVSVPGPKIGVDPNPNFSADYAVTSDEFFRYYCKDMRFDLIFIDGLHHADQVKRDVEASLGILNDRGTIVCHDCNPVHEDQQRVPRSRRRGPVGWTGDVWKAWVHFRVTRPDLTMFVVDCDCGCGVIRRGQQATLQGVPVEPTYADLEQNRDKWLKLVSPEVAQDWIVSGGTLRLP